MTHGYSLQAVSENVDIGVFTHEDPDTAAHRRDIELWSRPGETSSASILRIIIACRLLQGDAPWIKQDIQSLPAETLGSSEAGPHPLSEAPS